MKVNSIQDFYEIRQDGKIIPEGMTVEQIFALGEISRVVEAHWTNAANQRPVSLKSPFGVFAYIVPGREFIAAMVHTKKGNGSAGDLIVVNPDGSVRFKVPPVQTINGQDMKGVFRGITNTPKAADGFFGAVFEVDFGNIYLSNAQFRLDIDAATGEVVGCSETR